MIITRMTTTPAEGMRIGVGPYHRYFYNDDLQTDLHFDEYALYQNVKDNGTIEISGYQFNFRLYNSHYQIGKE